MTHKILFRMALLVLCLTLLAGLCACASLPDTKQASGTSQEDTTPEAPTAPLQETPDEKAPAPSEDAGPAQPAPQPEDASELPETPDDTDAEPDTKDESGSTAVTLVPVPADRETVPVAENPGDPGLQPFTPAPSADKAPWENILPVEPIIYETQSGSGDGQVSDESQAGEATDIEICGLPPADAPQALTQAQALADEAFGRCFLPAAPEGFTEEAISRSYFSLRGLWTNGYRELSWSVRAFTDADEARLTTTDKTENYDLSLYPIPRADSVPEALREIVDDPIFDAQDLTQDVVDARTYTGDEGYDCLHFSVRFENLLVTVRAKGVEPSWIFEQLCALAENA